MEKEKLINYLEAIPFWKHLEMKVKKMGQGYVELTMPFKEEFTQGKSHMHGGALASLLDNAGAIALRTYLEFGVETVATVEMKINYLLPVTSDQREIVACGRVIKAGRTLGVSTIEIKNDKENIVAVGIGTYVVVPQSDSK